MNIQKSDKINKKNITAEEMTMKKVKLIALDMDGTLYLGDQLYDFTKSILFKSLSIYSLTYN